MSKKLHSFSEVINKFTKFEKLPEAYEKAGSKFVEEHFEEALAEITDPFQTEMPVIVSQEYDPNSSIVWHVNIADVNTVERATTKYTGQTRSAWQLFYWLNSGTNIRKVTLPLDFNNETFVNSLETVSRQYDRAGIQYTSTGRLWSDGLEERNWIELISQTLPVIEKLNINKIIKDIK